MSKEKAVQLQSGKKTSRSFKKIPQSINEGTRICIIYCIIHYSKNSTETDLRPLTEHSFLKIRQSASVRKKSSDENTRLSDITENLPEELNNSVHGYHHWCYQNFTNVARLKRKIADPQTPDSNEASSSKRIRLSGYSKSSGLLFPADKCLFCNKQNLNVKGEKEQLVKCITRTAEASIEFAAKQKNDESLLCEIRGIDVIAKEAHYHNHCCRSYIRNEMRQSTNPNS